MHQFKAPHAHFDNAPRYDDYLADVVIPEPASLWDNKNNGSKAIRGEYNGHQYSFGSSIGKRSSKNIGRNMKVDETLPDDAYKHEAYQRYLKRYLRCVKGIDDNVKRLFDYLEKNDLMENTIIIYTGDQGFMLGEHDYIDKRWMYEESMRMPLLIRYPRGIRAGSRTDAIINNTDFAPTILDLAGGSTPKYMHGASFRSILETATEPDDWREETYYRYWMHMGSGHANPAHFGIRTKTHKLIFSTGSTI